MVHDKIALLLQDIEKLKEKLKDVKKDRKQEEVVDTEAYRELKKAAKDLRAQVKDMDDEHKENLKSDSFYNQLRELQLKTEEDLAQMNSKLFELIDELPKKFFEMNVDIDQGRVKVQVQPEMKVFVNGKEEKRRI